MPGTAVASEVLGFLTGECRESCSEGLSKRSACMYSCLLDKQEFSYLNIDHMTSFRVLNSSPDDSLKKLNLSSIGERSFLRSSVGKASAHNVGDLGLIPGLGSSPREGNGNPLQYSCLENPMDRGAWWATVHGIARVGYDLALS